MTALSRLRGLARSGFMTPVTIVACGMPSAMAFSTVADTHTGVVIPSAQPLQNGFIIDNATSGTSAVSGLNSPSITNDATGQINGINGGGIVMGSSVDNLSNSGRISGQGSGVGNAAIDITGAAGIITNTSTGVISQNDYNAIYLRGGVSTINNAGQIIGRFDQTVRVQLETGSFINSGMISSSADDAVFLFGDVFFFSNTQGTITAAEDAVRLGANITTFSNTGSITGGSGFSAVTIAGNLTGSFSNRGTIKGGTGVQFALAGTGVTFTNSGRLEGTGGTALQLTNSDDMLTVTPNSIIVGNVLAGNGTDTLRLLGDDGTSGTFAADQIGPAGQFRSFETFRKVGGGAWTLTGDNAAAMLWTATQGSLHVNGNMPNTQFNLTNTELGGTGTTGVVNVGAGASVAPGNSVGTLTTGTITFNPASTFRVEVEGASADKLVVNGTATLNGAAVNVVPSGAVCGGINAPIITTTGGVNGTFGTVTTTSAFLAPSITYDANNVYLVVAGNGRTFAGLGTTPNQASTAAALDALGCNNQPYAAQLLALSLADVPGALDALSGEAHAAIAGTLLENGSYIRGVVFDRVQQAFDALDADNAVSGYARGALLAPAEIDGKTYWINGYGGFGAMAGNGNAAPTSNAATGLVIGADGAVSEDWRLGVLAGVGTTGINARGTSGNSGDVSFGAYAGGHAGIIDIKVGAAYTRHIIQTMRTIAFPGVNDTMLASYQAGTAQAFVEFSSDFDVGAVTLTPFAQLAAVTHATDAFTETGGQGQLTTAANTSSAFFVTFGLGAENKFVLGNDMLVTAHGSIGWRHAFVTQPAGNNAFIGGGPFAIAAAPVAQDAAVLTAGLSFDISEKLSVDASYEGTIGSGLSSHAVKLTLAGKF